MTQLCTSVFANVTHKSINSNGRFVISGLANAVKRIFVNVSH